MKTPIQIIFLLFFSSEIFSQDGGSTKITIFQPGGVKTEDTKPPPPNKNLVKWNYSLITRGVFLMNYEFLLNDKLTAEVGGGLTYRDFIFELIKFDTLNEYKNTKVNFALEGSLRFYPKGNKNFEGIYLSPGISYRKYSFGAQPELYGNDLGYSSTFYPGYNFLDLQFRFGYQYENFWNDDLLGDFYIGFGYRNASVKYYQASYNNYNYNTEVKPVTTKLAFPQVVLGFKTGLPF